MDAAQIYTRAADGFVAFRLPDEYAAFANAELLVTVVPEPNQDKALVVAQTERQARLERLRATQAKLVALNPFRAISDPVQWQRELRDEWERPYPASHGPTYCTRYQYPDSSLARQV